MRIIIETATKETEREGRKMVRNQGKNPARNGAYCPKGNHSSFKVNTKSSRIPIQKEGMTMPSCAPKVRK